MIFSSGAGTFTQAVDFNNLPGTLALEPGDDANMQCWYRDVAGGGSGFNLSNAINIFVCP